MSIAPTAPPDRAAPVILGLAGILLLAVLVFSAGIAQADIHRFVGEYAGSAEVSSADGTLIKRDMSVTISQNQDGFTVKWTSTTYKPDGRTKEKTYEIFFLPTDREGVFSAAMRKNVFGHPIQLDPMKGEPYVWSRITGDTLSVFSLFVDDEGGYEIQQFDRTLAEGGLTLDYKSVRNGAVQRTVTTFLARQ